MLKRFQSFFIWSAGSDPEVLAHCPESERIKHAGYGALVWVPAVVGFFSMTYAVSTLTPIPFYYYAAGAAWSFIVFNIDRFIVSTTRKTIIAAPEKGNGNIDQKLLDPAITDQVIYEGDTKKDAFSMAFLIRVIFAIFVGIIVAHPVVLLTFRQSIDAELNEVRRERMDSLDAIYRSKAALLVNQKHAEYTDKEDKLASLIHDQQKAVDDETAGEVKKGYTGIYGNGPAAKAKLRTLAELSDELYALKQMNRSAEDSIDAQIYALRAANDTIKAKQADPRDYLARETALARITSREFIVWLSQWLLIIFFVLLDVLPVVFKTFTRIGKYDIILDHERISRKAWAYAEDGVQSLVEAEKQVVKRLAESAYSFSFITKELEMARAENAERLIRNWREGRVGNFRDLEKDLRQCRPKPVTAIPVLKKGYGMLSMMQQHNPRHQMQVIMHHLTKRQPSLRLQGWHMW